MQYDENDLMRRAMAAYFRSACREQRDNPSVSASTVEVIKGRVYTVLRNINGILEVYRYTNQGRLKMLRRWPAELQGE